MNLGFAGTPAFARHCLQALIDAQHPVCAVFTQPDRPSGRGQTMTPSPVKQLATQLAIPVYQPQNFKSATTKEQLMALDLDLMIVVAYGLLLPKDILQVPRLGCINVHASLLPRWRGAAPIQRALIAGDVETGVSLIQMTEALDAGPILAKRACAITRCDTSGRLHDQLAELGAGMLVENLPAIISQNIVFEEQTAELATYASKIHKSEACLDWTSSAELLERKVRAFNPWPVAYTYLSTGKRLRVWKAEAIVEADINLPAGQLRKVGPEGIEVVTGAGILKLLSVQLEGAKPLSVNPFLSGYPSFSQDWCALQS